MESKICTKCKKLQPISLFSKSKKNKSGFRSECKECRKSLYKKQNVHRKPNCKGEGIEKIIKNDEDIFVYCPKCKNYNHISNFQKNKQNKTGINLYCKDCIRQIKKSSYQKEKIRRNNIKKINSQITTNLNETKVCSWCNQEKSISEFSLNRTSLNGRTSYCKLCYNTHKQTPQEKIKRNQYQKNKLSSDIQYKIVKIIRTRLYNIINQKNVIKIDSHVKALGCDIDFLKFYIESQFLYDMTWENWGVVWQLDHIIPLSNFDLQDQNQFNIACHYSNLQPLYKHINLEKKDMIVDEQWYIDRGVYRKRDNLPCVEEYNDIN